MNPQKKEIDAFTTWMDPEGFVRTVVRTGAEITLKEAKQNTEAVVDVSGGQNYPILVDLRKIKSISKEARDHFSERGRKPHVTAICLLVYSPVSVVIGNFFIGLSKPAVPTKMFSDESKALDWIKQQL